MSNFIDRNPEQMIKYATDAKNLIGEMIVIIRKIEGVLDAYAMDLDEPTQKQIQKLHNCCDKYLKEISVYEEISNEIYLKGKKLNIIRREG